MINEETLHDQLRKNCRAVNGQVKQDNIAGNTTKCLTSNGTLKVRQSHRSLLPDETRVTITSHDDEVSSSVKNVDKIEKSYARIQVRADGTSFDLQGGQPQ